MTVGGTSHWLIDYLLFSNSRTRRDDNSLRIALMEIHLLRVRTVLVVLLALALYRSYARILRAGARRESRLPCVLPCPLHIAGRMQCGGFAMFVRVRRMGFLCQTLRDSASVAQCSLNVRSVGRDGWSRRSARILLSAVQN